MGYFSEISIDKTDRSYPSFEEQLQWRYEDLKDRYRDLLEADAPCSGEARFTDDDYRYAPIQYFETIADTFRALEMTKEDLEAKCGIIVRDELWEREEENDPAQITIFELALWPAWLLPAVAA